MVTFPISQENLAANMLRYQKDKLLYITIWSDVDCSPGIKVAQNKKDVTEVTVNLVTS